MKMRSASGDSNLVAQMAIWSLTSERLEKLKAQIAAKRAEYDELDALDEKDLWCNDLDAFALEWETQLGLDAEIQSNIRRTARRVSKKIGAGGGKARRLKGEDAYEPEKKGKAKAAKVPKPDVKTAQRFAEMFAGKPKKIKSELGGDGAGDDPSDDDDFMSLGKPKASQTSIPASSAADARNKRTASAKAKSYVIDDDDDDDDEFNDFMEVEEPAAPSRKVESAYASAAEEDDVQLVKRTAAAKAKPSYIDDDDLDMDEVEEVKPAKRTAATKAKPSYIDDEDLDMDEDEDVKPAKRTTASKAKPVYADDDDDEDEDMESDGDKMLGNIGAMVKGIGAPAADKGRLSLFAMSRPDTANESALPKIRTKASKSNFHDFDSHDDTNYEALAMSSPRKSTKADDLDGLLSDDDLPPVNKISSIAKASSSQATSSKAKAPLNVVSAAAKKRGRPAGLKSKSKDEPVAKTKPTGLSPAAKAYAAKKAKARAAFSDDEDEDMDAPASPVAKPAARGRPGRAATAKAKPVYVVDDDEDESDAFAMDDESD